MTSCLIIFIQAAAQRVPSPYLHLDPVVSVAQVLQVGGGVGLDGGEVMLQHVDDLRQLWVAPCKFPVGKNKGTEFYAKLFWLCEYCHFVEQWWTMSFFVCLLVKLDSGWQQQTSTLEQAETSTVK